MIVKEIELLTEGQTINGGVFQKYEADCLKTFKENPNIILILFCFVWKWFQAPLHNSTQAYY